MTSTGINVKHKQLESLAMANVDAGVKAAYEDVRRKDGSNTWFVLGYEGGKIVVQDTGSGGVDALVANFQDDQAQYGYIRLEFQQEETTRQKFVLISWIGENVSPLKKGKVSVDKPGLKAIVKDLNVELAASDRDDLTHEKVEQKVRAANY